MAFNLFYALFCSFGCQQKHYIVGNISLETLMMLNVNHLNVKIREGFFYFMIVYVGKP